MSAPEAALTACGPPAPDLADLLPPPVRLCAVTRFLDDGALLPEEGELVERAVAGRRAEFATGRACARALLAELGFAPAPLLRDPDRVPVWPRGAVGSISHTRRKTQRTGEGDLCVVAVVPAAEVAALGVDVEPDEALETEIWPRIATPAELDWLAGRPEAERGRLARRLFSVKECVYKAAFPRLRERWGFQEVSVTLDLEAEGFRAETPAGVASGRVLRRGGFLIAGVAHAAKMEAP